MSGDINDFEAAYLKAAEAAAESAQNHPAGWGRTIRPAHPDVDLEGVGPGWIIFSTATAVGEWESSGVCVEVQDSYTDPDTGELLPTRYRCLRYWTPGNPWVYVDAEDVDTNQLLGVDRKAASAGARWLVRDLNRQRRHDGLVDWEVNALHDAWRLARAVAR